MSCGVTLLKLWTITQSRSVRSKNFTTMRTRPAYWRGTRRCCSWTMGGSQIQRPCTTSSSECSWITKGHTATKLPTRKSKMSARSKVLRPTLLPLLSIYMQREQYFYFTYQTDPIIKDIKELLNNFSCNFFYQKGCLA